MKNSSPKSFDDEFWPYYVREHRQLSTRVWHLLGTTGGMMCLANGLVTHKLVFYILTPILGYGFAWFSHFKVEKNKPATFKHPWWSLRADLRMWRYMITGHMDVEVKRHCAKGPGEK